VDAPAPSLVSCPPPPRCARWERGRRLPGRRGRSGGAVHAGAGCGCRGRRCGPPPQGGRRTWGKAGRQSDVSTAQHRSRGHGQESNSKQEASRPQRPVEGRDDLEKAWNQFWRAHKGSPLRGVGPAPGRPGCAGGGGGGCVRHLSTRDTMVLLPLPLWPTSATVRPAGTCRLKSLKTVTSGRLG
jgi:hypothetical protein